MSGRDVRRRDIGTRPHSTLRPYSRSARTSRSRAVYRPPHRSYRDVRYARPSYRAVRRFQARPLPRRWTYRPYYTRWYCHPWYRYRYSTVAVVGFGFGVNPWFVDWVPPARAGWAWVPGYYAYGFWNPGFWRPVRTAPVGYSFVPGWWEGDVYVEGYNRVSQRADWEWVDGRYLDDGTYVRGHWTPTSVAPEGYTWEAGFWDGETYVDGFWRPEYRPGFVWVSAFYDEDGIFHGGYWLPQNERPGEEWIPGWFDGTDWVEGYWLPASDYTESALDRYVQPDGFDDGWDDDYSPQGPPPRATIAPRETTDGPSDVPLALPIEP
ncbi:MAG: hypothetical protein AAGA48_22885 [Myxococcota bacterium]